MASIVETIRAKLLADAAVTSLVGNRIYSNVMLEGSALPAIVCTVVSDVPENSFTGVAATRLKNVRVQVDCYARPAPSGVAGAYITVHQLAEAVDAVLAGLQLPELSGLLEVTRDLFDNETGYHRVSMDFTFWR